MSLLRKMNITADDGPSIDAFARWRVSSPTTIFDSKNIYDYGLSASENQPLYFDNVELSGSGTSTMWNNYESSQEIKVSENEFGIRVRQTKMRFNYKPGKSMEIILSFNFQGGFDGITKREGLFDENNGIFLELSDTDVYIVNRSNASGSVADNKVLQSNWNLDTMDGNGKSKINLDFTKTQLFFVDVEWLGVGRVRCGFVIDGVPIYTHQFLNTNVLDVVYMRVPNLPIRSEITNDGTGPATSMVQICSTVISEGGTDETGMIRYASTDGTHVSCTNENVVYAILGIRLKSNMHESSVKILNSAIQVQSASSKLEWFIVLNPTVAGTFNYQDEPYSTVQIARGATENIVTGGYKIYGGFIESGGNQTGAAGSVSKTVENAILLGSTIGGVSDTKVLCVRPIDGSDGVDVECSLTWRELN